MIDPIQSFINNFSYHKYIKSIDVKRLIKYNTVFDEAKGRNAPSDARCLLCSNDLEIGESLRLSNGNYICENCFKKVQTIRYPEFYQKRYEIFLIESEARRIAKEEFISSLPSTQLINKVSKTIIRLNSIGANTLAVFTYSFIVSALLLFFMDSRIWGLYIGGFTCLPAILFWAILSQIKSFKEKALGKAEEEQKKDVDNWNTENPEPIKPELREFHNPTAQMTETDRKILQVFDYWPGYPPYWGYIQTIILERDNKRCQISGCPSRTKIHIHHKLPISKGGSHRAENLVALCIFHHGLQPEEGHERVWGEVKTHYFNMVKAHFRNNSFIQAHVRRKELATKESINEIFSYYSIACRDCNHGPLNTTVDYEKNRIIVQCPSCLSQWTFVQKLPEESGPQIADTLSILSNKGSWKVDFSLMESIRSPVYEKMNRSFLAKKREFQKSKFEPNLPLLFCPKCGKPLRLRNGIHGKFWGCSGYPDCHYTRDYVEEKK